jgi:hypothetical protein
MDTTKYDQKMEELRNEEIKKSAGRPKGPEKVVYKRRIPPELAAYYDRAAEAHKVDPEIIFKIDQMIDKALKEKFGLPGRHEMTVAVDPLPVAPVSPHGDVLALLNDVERLEREKRELEEKVQRVARLTDNEKLILWIRKYEALVAKVKAKYPDEGF